MNNYIIIHNTEKNNHGVPSVWRRGYFTGVTFLAHIYRTNSLAYTAIARNKLQSIARVVPLRGFENEYKVTI